MPVVDLRLRFELERVEYSPLTVVIVLSLRTAAGMRECGIVVDAVADVVDLALDAIQTPPAVGGETRSRFVRGLVNAGSQMLIVLAPEELISTEPGPDTLEAA